MPCWITLRCYGAASKTFNRHRMRWCTAARGLQSNSMCPACGCDLRLSDPVNSHSLNGPNVRINTLRNIQEESGMMPTRFIKFLSRVRQILLEHAAEVVVERSKEDSSLTASGPYTVPRVYVTSCKACIRSKLPCIVVSPSCLCLSCFLRKQSPCTSSDDREWFRVLEGLR